MSKHTPGPWRNCQPSSNFEKGYAVIRPRDGDKGIASVTKNYKFGENDANARLIAAAPDLLAALAGMVAFFGVDIEDCAPDSLKLRAYEDARTLVARFGWPS